MQNWTRLKHETLKIGSKSDGNPLGVAERSDAARRGPLLQ